jgi:WD40 repeat protein
MRRTDLQDWQAFVRGEAHILARFPDLIWQGAGNQPSENAVGRRAVELQESGGWTRRPWLRLINRPDGPDACVLDLRFDGDPTEVVLANEGTQILVAESPSWIAPNAGGFSLWDVDTGRQVSRFPKPADISVSAFLPDGRSVIYRKAGCAWIGDLDGPESAISYDLPEPFRLASVAVSADGRLLAGGGALAAREPAPVLVWDTTTGECLYTIQGHQNGIHAMVFSPDGRHLITGCHDHYVRAWDAATGALVRDLGQLEESGVNDVAVSPDGRRVAACGRGWSATLKIWDLEGGAEIVRPGDRFDATKLVFTPDGLRLIVGHDTGQIFVFETGALQEVGRLRGHKAYVRGLIVTADGRRVVSCSDDRSVKVWDLTLAHDGAADDRRRIPGGVRVLRFSPEGGRLSAFSSRRKIVWDCRSGQPIGEMSAEAPYPPNAFKPSECNNTAYQTPDGRRTVELTRYIEERRWKQGPITVRDQPGGEQLQVIGTQDMGIWSGQLEITPDGERVIALLTDKSEKHHALTQWHASSGAILNHFMFQGDVSTLQLTPDSAGVFVAFGDGSLITFDIDTFEVVQDLRHRTQLVDAVISPDGQRIVTVGQDRSALVWDKLTGVPLARYIGAGDFGAVAASDRLIAIGDSAGDVAILELMGVEPGPRIVPLLRDYDRQFWICPYCGTRSPAMSTGETDTNCDTCLRALRVAQVPPCKKPPLFAAVAAAGVLRDYIREPPAPPPPRRCLRPRPRGGSRT